MKIGNLEVEIFGEGNPLICLHGGMGMDRNYFKTPGILGLVEQGFQVILFDFSGNGGSEVRDNEEPSLKHWVEDIEILVESLGLSNYSILGHSYGGMIAMKYAASQPSGLVKLILVNTAPFSHNYLNNPNADTFRLNSDQELKEYISSIWNKLFPDAQETALFDSINFRIKPYLVGKKELVSLDTRPDLPYIKAQTLLIVGEKDTRYLERNEEMSENIPSARLEIIPGAGHFPFIDQENLFLNSIIEFLKAN